MHEEYPQMRLPHVVNGDETIAVEHLPIQRSVLGDTIMLGRLTPKGEYLFGLQADNESRDMTEELGWTLQEGEEV